jgi:outer membrane protein OmpA-like peptidoglycan-associated protein
MLYVVSQLWPFLLSIFFVGVLTAVLVRQPEEKRWIATWLKWAVLAYAAAAVVAVMGAVIERAGFYVENGLASFAAFLIGCFIGTRFTRGSIRENKGWAIGLVPAAILWLIGNAVVAPRIETDLRQRVGRAVEATGAAGGAFTVAGRDVAFADGAPKPAALLDAVQDVDGVRLVTGLEPQKATAQNSELAENKPPESPGEATSPTAPPMRESPLAQESRQEQRPPTQIGAPAAEPAPIAEKPPADEQLSLHAPEIAQVAPAPAGPQAIEGPKAEPQSASKPGETDVAACQAAIMKATGNDEITFVRGTAKIPAPSASVLDKIVVILKKCPLAKFEVRVHMDTGGAQNAALSQLRSQRLVEYFEREGVAKGRLVGVGYGDKRRSTAGAASKQAPHVEFLPK